MSDRFLVPDDRRGDIRAFTVFEVNCGVCGEFITPSSATRRRVEADLREMGWSNTKRHGWVCPTCRPELSGKAG